MAVLLAGLPVDVPGTTINRLCGSGMDAVGQAARAIRAGDADLMIAGGVESMTRAPFVMPKAESAFSRVERGLRHDHRLALRQPEDEEGVRRRLDAARPPRTSPPTTASRRADQDAFAARSQARWAAAQKAGWFARRDRAGDDPAEEGRADRRRHRRASAPRHHRRDARQAQGRQRPGPHASPPATPRASTTARRALVLASEAAAKAHGLTPKARVVAMAAAGVAPRIMGIGPAPAAQRVLARAGLDASTRWT